MNKALPTFAVALAIFLYALGSADPKVPEQRPRIDLDFTGIDTLELATKGANEIKLSDKTKPGLSHSKSSGPTLRVVRTGSRLRISDETETEYSQYELTVPTTVRHFIVKGADFSAEMPLADIKIDAMDAVSWNGDARSVRIRDISKSWPDCECAPTISIIEGKVGQLRIESLLGTAKIADIDTITEATLVLGPKARFSVDGRRGLATLRVEDMPTADSVEVGPEKAKAGDSGK